jgi:hypothetical protein
VRRIGDLLACSIQHCFRHDLFSSLVSLLDADFLIPRQPLSILPTSLGWAMESICLTRTSLWHRGHGRSA